jgi:hypothetical protein
LEKPVLPVTFLQIHFDACKRNKKLFAVIDIQWEFVEVAKDIPVSQVRNKTYKLGNFRTF